MKTDRENAAMSGQENASQEKVYNVPAEWSARAWVDEQKYQSMRRPISPQNPFGSSTERRYIA